MKSLLVLSLLASALAGCGSEDNASSADQQKMRDAMSTGRKEGAMTPDQKSGFEKWKAGGSQTGAPGASAPTPGAAPGAGSK